MLAINEQRRSHEKETEKIQAGTESSHFEKTPGGQGAAFRYLPIFLKLSVEYLAS
jgi:hypothetical protein